MTSRAKILNSDKEVNAFRFNLKEQRCLQKNLGILDAEAVYSLKLIDLDNRGIKVFYKRFKDKVSRIRSYLSAEELSSMQNLEAKGLMPDINKPINISGALRIADAEKRLKIQKPDHVRKTKSAHPLMRQNTLNSTDSLAIRDNGTHRPNTTTGSYGVHERRLSSSLQSASKRTSVNGLFPEIQETPRSNLSPRSKSSHMVQTQTNKTGKYCKRTVDSDTSKVTSPRSPRSPKTDKKVSDPECKRPSILVNSVKSLMNKIREANSNDTVIDEEQMSTNDQKTNSHKKMHVRIDTESVSICPDSDDKEKSDNNSHSHALNENNLAVPRVGDKKNLLTVKPQLRKTESEGTEDNTVQKEIKVTKPQEKNAGEEGYDIVPERLSLSRVSNVTRNSSTSAGQFSCHTLQDKDGQSTSRLDMFSGGDDKVGDYLGDDPYEERRKMLLQGEQEKTEELIDQKEMFMERLDMYIKEMEKQNRQMSIIPTVSLDVPDSVLRQARKEAGDRAKAKRLKKMQQGMHRSSISEEERRRRAQEMWKDVNKCRYLRVPSDRIDLSGIVTLATEQMKLFNAMRPVDEM